MKFTKLFPVFKERIKTAIDDNMYVTFSNEDSNVIQVAYSVKNSLVFDYQIVNTQHWSGGLHSTYLFSYRLHRLAASIFLLTFFSSRQFLPFSFANEVINI